LALGATTNYGVYAEGNSYGGYFLYDDSYRETGYGAYGIAKGSGGSMHYGGYFEALGATTNYGVYAKAAPGFAGGFEGDVEIKGDGGKRLTMRTSGAANDVDSRDADLYFSRWSGEVQNIVAIMSEDKSTTFYGPIDVQNSDSTGDVTAVYGRADGSGGTIHYGGRFDASGADTNNYGVYGYSDGYGSRGVYGTGDIGVEGNGSTGVSGTGLTGVHGYGVGDDGIGVVGIGGEMGVEGYAEHMGIAGYGIFGYGHNANGVGGYGNHCDFAATGPGENLCEISSIRWKRNITEIDCALDKVVNLRGIYFDWDEDHGGRHDMGMIAEEVGDIVPEAVVYEEDGVYAWAMNYGSLTPLLVEAIKEQNKIIAQLKELVCLDHPDAEVCAQ
jgi:hypothetical protein